MSDLTQLWGQLDVISAPVVGDRDGCWWKDGAKDAITAWLAVHDQAEDAEIERLKVEMKTLRDAATKYRDRVRYGLRHGYDDRMPWLSEEARVLRIALGEVSDG